MPDEMISGNSYDANSEIDGENSEAMQDTSQQDTDENSQNQENKKQDNAKSDKNNSTLSENSAQSDEADENGSADESADNTDNKVFLTLDGENITAEQAKGLVKAGRDYQAKNQPILDKIDMIMTSSKKNDGTEYQSVDEFVDSLLTAIDNSLMSECLDDAGGNEKIADELFKSRKAERESKYKTILENRKTAEQDKEKEVTKRVADEFENLQKEFPEIKTYAELPTEIKKYASENNVSLLSAKLLYDHKNRMASNKQKETENNNSQSNIGPQNSSEKAGSSPVIEAMLNGIRASY